MPVENKKIPQYFFLLFLFIFIFTIFYKPPLPEEPEIVDLVKNNIEPLQEETDLEPFDHEYGKFLYEITPQYDYELYGLIVSQYNSESLFDLMHQNDPGNTKDICVVWGSNIRNNAYSKVKYRSGEFTCFYEWDTAPSPAFVPNAGSNNHLIPKNEELEKIIKDLQIGDQIKINGYLVNYKTYNEDGRRVSSRDSSTSRDDKGNGACETLFVTDIELLKQGSRWEQNLKTISLWGMLISAILSVAVIFIPHRKKSH